MRQFLREFTSAALVAAVLAVPAASGAFAHRNIGDAVVGNALPAAAEIERNTARIAPETGAEPVELALNQIIRVGPRALRPSWRCAVSYGGNRYYSEAITEAVARARLGEVTDAYAYCRKRERNFFF
jgi:hypothetical protein